jgi:hypothetical protein
MTRWREPWWVGDISGQGRGTHGSPYRTPWGWKKSQDNLKCCNLSDSIESNQFLRILSHTPTLSFGFKRSELTYFCHWNEWWEKTSSIGETQYEIDLYWTGKQSWCLRVHTLSVCVCVRVCERGEGRREKQRERQRQRESLWQKQCAHQIL